MSNRLSRESNFELLRIIAMIGIVFSHFYLKQFTFYDVPINFIFLYIISISGKFGVNIFVIISGYFLINSNKVTFSKVMKLLGMTFFYSVTGFAISCAIGESTLSFSSIISAMTPIISDRWWFASSYIVLFIIHPALNKMIFAFDKKSFTTALITAVILWSVIPTLTGTAFQLNSLIQMILLYLIGAYIRFNKDAIKLSSKACFGLSFGIYMLILASIVSIYVIGKLYFSKLSGHEFYLTSSSSVLQISSAAFAVLGVSKTKTFSNKIINTISSTTFGIYLIHENDYIRLHLWNIFDWLNGSCKTPMFILQIIATAMIIFIGSALIDFIRINTIEKVYMKFINSVENFFTRKKKDA